MERTLTLQVELLIPASDCRTNHELARSVEALGANELGLVCNVTSSNEELDDLQPFCVPEESEHFPNGFNFSE